MYFVSAYLIGNIMFGYLVMKYLHGKDIRMIGSGNVGARNAGRFGGKSAFVIIFLGDALKGVTVILLGRYLGYSEAMQLLGLGFAVIGHIKPITLKFKGGKGISTFIGGILAFQPLLTLVIISAFLVFYPLTKSFTLAGLGTLFMIPVVLLIGSDKVINCFIIFTIIILILLAHSQNIKERLTNHEQKS
ncbi:glycerol-3-phosphate 1-O-acyltransferase PlsY [Bacillus rubiinfantis]|uniref:glycerol-3-phosphate 1-O-acyltransferase PlsY n=1 Tax=Bacillus rubiinfantis TaxID=1499680 RepID=UPI000694A9F6|nr:glycerol-3-phosphate 1-O-acyltransferase PlsY [Bacillus rubiinfantis]